MSPDLVNTDDRVAGDERPKRDRLRPLMNVARPLAQRRISASA
jgi:hypothetical protein